VSTPDCVFPFGLPVWEPGSAVAIGVFDGVHQGHRALVAAARDAAAASGGTVAALTFDPHPLDVLRPGHPVPLLGTLEERCALLREAGVERIAVARFCREFASQDPTRFARDILAGRLGARDVVVGEDFRFGTGQRGDVAALRALGKTLGFATHVVPEWRDGSLPARSTVIRGLLEVGEVASASRLLGRDYSVPGVVVPGKRLGRTIGFPTANLESEPRRVVPASGVYAGWVDGSFGRRMAAVSVGVNATIDPAAEPTVEAHLLDFDGDLYGQRIVVTFHRRLRGMVQFDGLPALVAQIQADVNETRRYLKTPS